VSTVSHIHCPSCGASDVRESHSRNVSDALLGLFGMVPYRCRACRSRFHKRPPSEDDEEFEDEGPEAESESDSDRK